MTSSSTRWLGGGTKRGADRLLEAEQSVGPLSITSDRPEIRAAEFSQEDRPTGNGSAVSPLSVQVLGSDLLEVALRTTEAGKGAILLTEGQEGILITGAAGEPKKSVPLAPRDGQNNNLLSRVLKQREPLILNKPTVISLWPGWRAESKDAVCVPLTLGTKDLGVLWVSDKQVMGHFDQEDVTRLTALARPCAAVLALSLRWMPALEADLIAQRRHLAQQIHDGPVQEFTALVLQLELSEKFAAQEPEKLKGHMAKVKQQARTSLQGLRRLIFDLRAEDVEEMDLVPLLERALSSFREKTHIESTLKITSPLVDLSAEEKGNLLAIVREALNNVAKHAQAGRVEVELGGTPRGIQIKIVDNGRGFSVKEATQTAWQQKKFGLMGMVERAHLMGGTLDIKSRPGQGTVVTLTVPARGPRGR
ncbi:MAG: GAF domain-containing sensor histidine kinase [Chloroflexi bacterium]|nr:GAF domain-containing sensor histidine kinase [Chloroflexota bacterium]